MRLCLLEVQGDYSKDVVDRTTKSYFNVNQLFLCSPGVCFRLNDVTHAGI